MSIKVTLTIIKLKGSGKHLQSDVGSSPSFTLMLINLFRILNSNAERFRFARPHLPIANWLMAIKGH